MNCRKIAIFVFQGFLMMNYHLSSIQSAFNDADSLNNSSELYLESLMVDLRLKNLFLIDETWKSIDMKQNDTKGFPGNYSLNPEEIYRALKFTCYQDSLKILEFGAGEGTAQLTMLLKKKNVSYDYHVFENAVQFVKELDNVTYYLYDLPNNVHCNQWGSAVENIELPILPIFDLIIVDGPHGVSRAKWYCKFKKYTRPGTVILIDDFHHYKEFEEALEKNFKYITIVEYNQTPTWKLINEGLYPLNPPAGNKTFKIVIVEEVLPDDFNL
ncbi:MAG: hypothetical protein Q8K60_06785 [Parachlamydiaceae bacterium]|nr:hypothetical protein [Parachlamydiaceae bacterium]